MKQWLVGLGSKGKLEVLITFTAYCNFLAKDLKLSTTELQLVFPVLLPSLVGVGEDVGQPFGVSWSICAKAFTWQTLHMVTGTGVRDTNLRKSNKNKCCFTALSGSRLSPQDLHKCNYTR